MTFRTVLAILLVAIAAACATFPAGANKSCTLTNDEWLALPEEARRDWQPTSCQMVVVRAHNLMRLDRENWRERRSAEQFVRGK